MSGILARLSMSIRTTLAVFAFGTTAKKGRSAVTSETSLSERPLCTYSSLS